MSECDEETLKNLKEEYTKVAKRILKKDISTMTDTLKRYENDIVKAHNNVTAYLEKFYDEESENRDQYDRNKLIKSRQLQVSIFHVPPCTMHIHLPGLHT